MESAKAHPPRRGAPETPNCEGLTAHGARRSTQCTHRPFKSNGLVKTLGFSLYALQPLVSTDQIALRGRVLVGLSKELNTARHSLTPPNLGSQAPT